MHTLFNVSLTKVTGLYDEFSAFWVVAYAKYFVNIWLAIVFHATTIIIVPAYYFILGFYIYFW